MLDFDEIEILELDSPEVEKQDVVKNEEEQPKNKLIPFFLVYISILVVTQIVVFGLVAIKNM